MLILTLFLLTGCDNLSQMSDEDLERISDKAVVCSEPYIRLGTTCCLDENKNNICDNDENTNNGVVEPIKEENQIQNDNGISKPLTEADIIENEKNKNFNLDVSNTNYFEILDLDIRNNNLELMIKYVNNEKTKLTTFGGMNTKIGTTCEVLELKNLDSGMSKSFEIENDQMISIIIECENGVADSLVGFDFRILFEEDNSEETINFEIVS